MTTRHRIKTTARHLTADDLERIATMLEPIRRPHTTRKEARA